VNIHKNDLRTELPYLLTEVQALARELGTDIEVRLSTSNGRIYYFAHGDSSYDTVHHAASACDSVDHRDTLADLRRTAVRLIRECTDEWEDVSV
jgi:hypothetical protein